MAEIAEILGIPPGTVRSRLHHAHRAMRASSRPTRARQVLEVEPHDRRSRHRTPPGAWLADGPTQVSDHVFADASDACTASDNGPRGASCGRSPACPIVQAALAIAPRSSSLPSADRLSAGPGGVIVGVAVPTASPSPVPTPSPPPLPDGLLHAGDYVMRALPADPMGFTIAAPEGWTGFGGFFIGGPQLSDAPSGIGISVNHDPQVTTDPCDGSVPTPAPASNAPSVDELVTAISARADLQVSGVADAELAGYTGKRLDVQFPTVLACGNHYVFAEPKGLYANGPANRWRLAPRRRGRDGRRRAARLCGDAGRGPCRRRGGD